MFILKSEHLSSVFHPPSYLKVEILITKLQNNKQFFLKKKLTYFNNEITFDKSHNSNLLALTIHVTKSWEISMLYRLLTNSLEFTLLPP